MDENKGKVNRRDEGNIIDLRPALEKRTGRAARGQAPA